MNDMTMPMVSAAVPLEHDPLPREATDAERWTTEADFFDREANAARVELQPFAPAVLERYARLKRRRWNKEFRFRLLGDLRGKRVLDVGCGDGMNSVLLAAQGAQVTGIDISPGAIDLARDRAALNGVADRTTFICAPIEAARLERASFDVIWIDALLHHVLPVLETTLRALDACRRPDGQVIVSEPINLFPALRQLRLRLPLATHATPGERPLEHDDLAVVERVFPGIRLYGFHGLGRLVRFVLPPQGLEPASPVQRAAANALALADQALLSLPPLRPLAGVGVLHYRPGAID